MNRQIKIGFYIIKTCMKLNRVFSTDVVFDVNVSKFRLSVGRFYTQLDQDKL